MYYPSVSAQFTRITSPSPPTHTHTYVTVSPWFFHLRPSDRPFCTLLDSWTTVRWCPVDEDSKASTWMARWAARPSRHKTVASLRVTRLLCVASLRAARPGGLAAALAMAGAGGGVQHDCCVASQSACRAAALAVAGAGGGGALQNTNWSGRANDSRLPDVIGDPGHGFANHADQICASYRVLPLRRRCGAKPPRRPDRRACHPKFIGGMVALRTVGAARSVTGLTVLHGVNPLVEIGCWSG